MGGRMVKRGTVVGFVLVQMLLMSVFATSAISGAPTVPDVTIINVTSYKTVVSLGYSLNITVTAANPGEYPEPFNVIVYANTTVVETRTVNNLNGISTVLDFSWNTTGFAKGNYTLNGYAQPVPGETNTADNNFSSPTAVLVTILPGDLLPPFGVVDMKDIAYISKRFSTDPSKPLWNPNADINGDVRVNMKDIAITVDNFGGFSVVHPFEHVVVDDTTYAGVRSVGDVDGDGFSDIVAARGSSGLTWYKYPTWNKYPIQSANWQSDDIDMVDVDGDGDLDIVGAQDDDGKVYWYENPRPTGNAMNPWASHYIGTSGDFVKDLEVDDFNRDGKLDVVTRTPTVTSVFSQNSPTSWSKVKTLAHQFCDGLDVGDVDGDGIPDIILNGFWIDVPADLVNGAWTRYNIDSKWWNQNTGDWRDNNAKVAVVDINGDGRLDVFFSQSEKPNYPVSWYESSDPRGGTWREHVVGYADYCHTLKTGDMDRDGSVDLVVGKFERDDGAIPAPYFVKIFYNKGRNGLSWQSFLVDNISIYTGTVGDIGNDGDLDIVGSRSYWKGPIEIWMNQLNDNSGKLPSNQ
jgi:hypothetical protein